LFYVIVSLILVGIIFTLALCKAAGRADEWEEQMEYKKDK
jgi:hypothetical protein